MFCENCGYKIEDGAFFCENCGYKIETNPDFCENCDENLDQEIALSDIIKESKTEEPKTPKKKGKIALIITSVVLSIAIVAGSIFTVRYFLKKKAAQPSPLSDYNSYVYLEEGFTDVKIVDDKSAIEAVASVSDILGIKNPKEELKNINTTKVGNTNYYRMQQYYDDIPVHGSNIVVASDDTGYALTLTSNFANMQNVNTKQKISSKDAINIVKDELGEEISTNSTLVFFNISTNASDYCLAYKINVSGEGIFKNYFVSAADGNIIHTEDSFMNARVPASGKDINGDPQNFYCEKLEDDSYILYDSERNIRVYDLDYSEYTISAPDGIFTVEWQAHHSKGDILKSKSSDWKNKKAVTVMSYLNKVYDYYNDTFEVKGLNNVNGEIMAFINRPNGNATSHWAPGISQTVITVGDGFYNLDTIAHEYTHSMIGCLIWLKEGESGAINEAYADIMGELVEDSDNWIHRKRNMASPLDNKYCNYYKGKYWDDGDVYKKSTVISHAAYLMWDQKDSTNTHLLSSEKMANLWFNSIYLLQSYSDFSQCRNAVELSARIMHKNGELTEAQLTTVSKAFDQVGIDNAIITHKYTTKNDFDLEICVSDKTIKLDKNSRLESNFNLEVVKLELGSEPEQIMYKENITNNYKLSLEDGYYGLLIRDAKSKESTPINIYIRVDGKNDNTVDKIKLETDFTATRVTNLQEETQITNSTPKEYTTKLDNSIISIFEDMLNASEFVWSKGANFSKMSVDDILGSYMLAYKVPSGVYGYFSEDPFAFIDEDPDNVCHDPKGKFDVTCCLDADLADWILINVFNKTPDRTRVTDSYYYQGDTLYRSGGTGGGGPGGDYAVVGYKSLGKGKFELSVRMNYDGDLGYDYKFTASPKYDKEKGYYWSIYSYKMIIETETKPDNTISIPVIDSTDDKEQSSTKPLPKLSENGHGRTRFYVNGMGIASGDRVSDVIAEGFTTKMDLSQVLGPKEWTGFQFKYNTSSGKSEIISVHVINETDKKRTIKDSRIYYLFLSTDQEDITIDNGTKLTKEYVNAKYEVNGKRTVGEPLNYIVLNNYNDNECGVTTIYLENVYPTMKFKEGALDYGNFNEVSACNMMKDYMDISGYLNDDEATRNSLLNEKLGKDVLSIKVENKTLNFGKSGSSMSSLINSGWRLPNSDLDGFEFSDENLEKTLRVGEPDKNIFYSSTFNSMKTNDGKTVDDVEIANFGEIPITANEGKLSGIRLFCEDYYSYQNNDYVSFEFYDLSDKSSTIQDIIKRLGNPKQLTGQADINLVIMWYDFVDKDGIRFLIGITVDPLSNEMCNISIGHVAPQS